MRIEKITRKGKEFAIIPLDELRELIGAASPVIAS